MEFNVSGFKDPNPPDFEPKKGEKKTPPKPKAPVSDKIKDLQKELKKETYTPPSKPLPGKLKIPNFKKETVETGPPAKEAKEASHARLIEKVKKASFKPPSDRELQTKISEIEMKGITRQKAKSTKASGKPYPLQKLGTSANPVTLMPGGQEFVSRNELMDKVQRHLEVESSDIEKEIVNSVPGYYKKDELLTELRNLMNRSEDPLERESILSNINEVKSNPNSFIEERNIDPELLRKLKQNHSTIQEYVSLSDFEQIQAEKGTPLDSLITRNSLGFVFKTGRENERELLANKLVSSLGLQKPLVAKWEVDLPGASLEGNENPHGIASRFVEGSTGFGKEEWKGYTTLKMKVTESEFRQSQNEPSSSSDESANEPLSIHSGSMTSSVHSGSMTSQASPDEDTLDLSDSPPEPELTLEEKKAELQRQDELLLTQSNVEDIQTHVLTDLIFSSYDSHIDQFMRQGSAVWNVDLARFGAPNDTLSDEGQIFPTLRTVFLDHPASEEPLNPNLVQQIKSWNPAEIEKEWRKDRLVGEEEFFTHAVEELQQLESLKSQSNSKKLEILEKVYKASGLPEQMDTSDIEKLKKTLSDTLTKKYEEIKKACYSKLHPQAFENILKRMNILQAYVKECEESGRAPTVKEAFKKMYPDFVVFNEVLGRFQDNPGESLASAEIPGGGIMPRNLQSILRDAISLNLATDAEIAEMEAILDRLTQTSPPLDQIRTTMDSLDIFH